MEIRKATDTCNRAMEMKKSHRDRQYSNGNEKGHKYMQCSNAHKKIRQIYAI